MYYDGISYYLEISIPRYDEASFNKRKLIFRTAHFLDILER